MPCPPPKCPLYFSSLFLLLLSLLISLSLCHGPKEDLDLLLLRRISTGLLRGKSIPLGQTGSRAFAFLGLPYAKSPSGQLRFRPPQPPDPWPGVRDAGEFGPSCHWNTSYYRAETASSLPPMAEDCLLANVFASERCLRTGGCPVLHYIYGGQFMFGTARRLDPQTITENFCSSGRDLVVVTFGYRMNVFGLLNLNNNFPEVNPPNMAIHDIVASLHWTRREIAHFGGSPDRVSLAGQSSGSVAAQILSVCPKANFLFNQIISMSGPGTIEMLPKNRNQRSSRRLALSLGCVSAEEWPLDSFWSRQENVVRVLDCLRVFPPSVLSSALPQLELERLFFHGLATETGTEAIITDTFPRLMAQNPPRHPLLTGTVSREFVDASVVLDTDTGRPDPVRLWLYCRRLIRQLNYENGEAALGECVREYSDGERTRFLFEDVTYFVPHLQFAARSAGQGLPTFLYQFEYQGIGAAFQGDLPPPPPELTPRHAQDLVYLLGQNKGANFSAKDRRIQRLQSALFANFVANGTLNGGEIQNARPFSPALLNYYRIDFEDQRNWTAFAGDTPGYHARAVQFWTQLMPRVAGKSSPLSDEAFIDDRMLSDYLPDDLSKFRQFVAPWLPVHSWGQLLLWTLSPVCLLGWVLFCCVWTRRKRTGYEPICSTEEKEGN